MTQAESRSTKDLFRAWRSGDGEAGQLMAQRFADWYYAIATSRLGERAGHAPCQAACGRFGTEIVEVTDSRSLVGWAHDILQKELAEAGDRLGGLDEVGAFTSGEKPSALILRAQTVLTGEIALLQAVYSGADEDEIRRLAEPFGGQPLATLVARSSLKRWLRDHAGVPFQVAPDTPVLDHAPLPLYEAGRMQAESEITQFERWILTDIDLCKDVAEFAHFAIVLRSGSTPEAPPVLASSEGPPPSPPTSTPREASPPRRASRTMWIVGAVGLLGLLLILFAGLFVGGWLS